MTKLGDSQQKKKKEKRTCQTVDFAVLPDHRLKLKESKKRDSYLDYHVLAFREQEPTDMVKTKWSYYPLCDASSLSVSTSS